ncbi:MAG: N-6 DNA methylase [Sporichthyaceae bacterium]
MSTSSLRPPGAAAPEVTAGSVVEARSTRKARGAFFTPPLLCEYVAAWAVRGPGDGVLEPSCGEAAFLLAAAERLSTLRAGAPAAGPAPVLDGYELHSASARTAGARVAAAGHQVRIRTADFLTVPAEARYDAVIGNPPYIRYQDFTGEARAAGRRAALAAGVPLTRLASSWAAFTVHAASFLRPGGRLGLVLPAELLSVNYAAEVRTFLMRRFARVRLVLFTERIFPGVLAEVVLVLAEGEGPAAHCELLQVRDVAELAGAAESTSTWAPVGASTKWTAALLPAPARAVVERLAVDDRMSTLATWGTTRLGAVTGNNRWFALTPAQVDSLGLESGDLVSLSPPGSRHLRTPAFTTAAWRELGADGARTWLLRPEDEPSAAAAAYIRAGERAGVDLAYKCRVRTPWWRVPLSAPPCLFLTYMNADAVALSANRARAHHLNSVHGVYLTAGLRVLGADVLPLAALNSVTLLGSEIVGRAYGGGLLKLEPREADRLPLPTPAVLRDAAPALRAARRAITAALADGDRGGATEIVDTILLRDHLGLTLRQVVAVQHAHSELAARRAARARSARDRKETP